MPNLRGKTWTTTTPANVEDAQYWEDHLISDADATKIASSVQSVNNTPPDAQGNVDIVALPAGGTAGQVLTKQSSTAGDADWEDPASSGHTIEDEDGNIMPYQETLQFENAEVTNDSVNNKTIVDCKGSKGDAATITVGTVTTLPAGSDATVTNSGTSSDAVFDFGIPKGADGEGAVDSVNGYTGAVVLDASDVGALPDSTNIPTKTSELDNDSGFVTSSAIPTSLSELSEDTTHRLVTDAEKTDWDAKVSETLLKDTVGWVGKNRLKITSETAIVHGVTFTVYKDANGNVLKVRANGTNDGLDHSNFSLRNNDTTRASAEALGFASNKLYKFSGCVGGSDSTYFIMFNSSGSNKFVCTDGEVEDMFVSSETYYPCIRVVAGQTVNNVDFYPMLRDASIIDSTFEPYHSSVEQTLRDAEVIEGKNKLKVPSSVVTTTKNGATFTVTRNADGEVTEIDVDTSGNATSGIADLVIPTNLKAGSYIINGCPANGGDDTYRVDLRDYAGTGWTSAGVIITKGADVPFTLSADTGVSYYIRIGSGQTLSHKKFYPMFCDASETDSTFEPYYIPLKDSKFDRAEQRVLGAKQWFNTKDLRNSDGVTIVTANKNVRIQNATASSWFGRFFYIPVRPNTDYLYTVDVAVTSGKGCVSVKKNSDGTDIVSEINITSNGRQTLAFNSGSETTVRLGYYSTCGTSETGDISYDNILITLAGDTDRTWVDYAMTNRELTEKFLYNSKNGYAKVGNIVVWNCAISLTQALIAGWNTNHPNFSMFPIPVQNCILNVYDRTGQSYVNFMFASGGVLPDKAYAVGNNFYVSAVYLTS